MASGIPAWTWDQGSTSPEYTPRGRALGQHRQSEPAGRSSAIAAVCVSQKSPQGLGGGGQVGGLGFAKHGSGGVVLFVAVALGGGLGATVAVGLGVGLGLGLCGAVGDAEGLGRGTTVRRARVGAGTTGAR